MKHVDYKYSDVESDRNWGILYILRKYVWGSKRPPPVPPPLYNTVLVTVAPPSRIMVHRNHLLDNNHSHAMLLSVGETNNDNDDMVFQGGFMVFAWFP